MSRHLVLVESNTYGLLALTTAKELGYYVSFLRSPHFEHIYKYDATYRMLPSLVDNLVVLDDIFNEEKLSESFAELDRKRPVDAVISVSEYVVLPVARAADRVGLLYTGLEGVENCRDKSKMRQRLREANLNNIDFVTGHDPGKLLREADGLGYPLVVKPAGGAASLLAKKANSSDELKTILENYSYEFDKLATVYQQVVSRKILIEKYVKGQVFSLEIGAVDNHYFPFATID